MRAAVIFNPSAGRSLGEAVATKVEQRLGARGLEVRLLPTQSPQHAVALARESAPTSDVIVAVGGDGTINEVVNGMMEAAGAAEAPAGAASTADGAVERAGHRCRLGIVPAGTVNVLAFELGLPARVERACDVIAAGRTMALDLGKVNDRRFTLMTGAGTDALTVRNIDPRAKRRLRELAFFGTGLTKGLADRPPEFSVTVNGTTHRATFFVAGNCRYYAAHLAMTPGADPTDGLLDILLFDGTTRPAMLAFWAGVPSGMHLRNANVICLRAERAELAPSENGGTVWLQTDGEAAGELPATVEIEPHALDVLVP